MHDGDLTWYLDPLPATDLVRLLRRIDADGSGLRLMNPEFPMEGVTVISGVSGHEGDAETRVLEAVFSDWDRRGPRRVTLQLWLSLLTAVLLSVDATESQTMLAFSVEALLPQEVEALTAIVMRCALRERHSRGVVLESNVPAPASAWRHFFDSAREPALPTADFAWIRAREGFASRVL